MPWKTFFSNAGSKDGKKKKNKSLSSAAKVRVHNQTPRTNSYGVTQADVDEVQSGRIRTTQRKQESERETAPAPTTGVGRLGAKNKYAGQMAMTGTTTYFEEEKRASERLKERGVSTYHDVKGEGVPSSRINSSGKIRNKTSAGTRKTYKNPDGSVGYYYEKPDHGFKSQRQYHETGDERYLTGETGKKPVASGIKSKFGIDRSERFYTQESPNTLKYDDGKKTEYYERQGDRYVSVPEERYNQVRLLNSGRNPSDYSFDKRAADRAKAAGQNIKAAVKGVGVSTNVGRENKGYQLAMQYMDGKNLSEKQESFMRGTKAGQAVLKGDYRTARELVNQETRERQLAEQGVLREQEKANMRAEISKIGASKPAQFALDVGGTALEMAPGMAMNAVAPGTFLAEMAFQSYGNSYNNARLQGASHNEAVVSGLQNAAVETLSEMMFAGGKTFGKMTGVKGIFHPAKEIEDASLAFIKTTSGRDIVRTAQKLGLASAEEGAEELVAGIVEPIMDNLIYQHEDMNSEWWEQTIHDALYNTLVGAAMGGGFGVADVVQSYRSGEAIREHADVANMINTGLSMPEDSASYMLARRLDVQTRSNPEMLGNIDTAELNAALQKDMQKVQENYDKEMETTKRSLAKKGLENVRTHAERDYVVSSNRDEDAANGEITEEEAKIYHSTLGDKFGAIYERARDSIASKIQRAPSEEATEEDVESMYEEAKADASSPARSIAKILTGEGTAADTANLMVSNPAAREVFEEISGQRLPANNADTIAMLNRINATNNQVSTEIQASENREQPDKNITGKVVAEARTVLGRTNHAVDVFYDMTASIPDEDLYAAKDEFVSLYDAGTRSNDEFDLERDLREPSVLSIEQQRIAFNEGAKARGVRIEKVKSREKKIESAKKSGRKRDVTSNDVKSKLNDNEQKKAKKLGLADVADELQKSLHTTFVLESNRSIDEASDSGVSGAHTNGWYDPSDDTIHLNIDAVRPLDVVFSHEFTHHLQQYAPKEYQDLIDYIKKEKANNSEAAWQRMIDSKMEEYERGGVLLKSRDDAVDEIVADMAYEFLNDERAMHRLFGYDKDLATKIRQTILDVIDRLLEVLKNYTSIAGSQWKGMEEQLEGARERWLKAAEAAMENSGLDVHGVGETQFAVGDTDPSKYTEETLIKELELVEDGTYGNKTYIPIRNNTPAVLIDSVNSYNSDESIKDYPLIMQVEKIRQAMAPKTEGQKRKRGHELSRTDFVNIIKKLDSPVKIIKQKRGNYAEIVEHVTQNGDKVWVAFAFGDNYNPEYLNGYDPGAYNTIRTLFSPDEYNAYLEENMDVDIPIVIKKASSEEVRPEKGASHSDGVPSSDNNVSETVQSRNQNAQKEQKQLSLSSLGMTEQNGKAAWLPERIDRLMREYGSSDPKYSKAFAAMISPRDYLKLTLGDRYLDMWNEGAKDSSNMDMRQLSEEDLRKETQTPFLTIYSRDGMNVQGHEGRHRMRALMEAGITSVPVVIQDPDTKYTKPSLPSMTLYSQDFGNGPVNGNAAVTVTDVVPITRYNRDDLIEKFGAKENDQVKFSISAEEDRKYLDAVKRGDMSTARSMVAQAAQKAGYKYHGYHGSNAMFTRFDPEKLGSKNFMAGSAYLGFFASGSRETAESYIGLNSMDIFGASLSEESMKIMDDIKQRRGFEKRLAEYNQQKERFEEQYKADHGYKEEVEDKLNYFMENAGALDLDSEANKRLRDNLQMHLQYEWNDKNLNAMESAWRQTDEHKAFQAFDEEIFSEWEPTELKRRGFTPNVKELYIKLDNPLVYDFKGEGRDPDSFAARMAEAKRDGKDGCIFLNVSDGADLDTIYTVFNNTQFKSADPVVYDDGGKMIPLSERFNDTNEDTRYSLSVDSDGRALTAEQQDFFKNSKIRDDQGRLKVMYHGTKNDFTVFKFDQGGKNGRAEGFGIYLSDNPEVSRHYGERMIEGYANIARPARSDQRTIKRAELKRLIKAAVNADAERWDMDGRDTWISNYTNTYEKSLDASISDVADMILGSNENDMDIVQEVMAGMGIRDYDDAITFYDMLTDVTGIDGFVTEWENQETGEPSQIVLAFRSNQIKNATNKMPTDDPDIRYSIDTKGRSLTEGQKTFFKNSKARDEDGRLRVLYHSSPEQFYEFDNERLGSNTGYANTAFGHFVTDYLPFSERFGENQMELYANIENLAVHPFGAAAKYSGDELEQITRDWLELTDPEQLNVYEEYKQDDPDLSLYDFYMDLWVGDDPFDYADDQRELLENAGYDGIELFEGNENQLSADNTGEEKPVTTYAVFNSNQLKDVDNKMPTKSPDIRYSINTPIKELDHTDKTVTDKNGNPVAKFDKAGGVQFSISTYEGMGREILNKYLNNMVLQGDMDQDEADQIRDELEKVYDICKEYADTKKYVPFTAWSYAEVVRGANGRPVFSAIKNNSEYKMNIDFSTICKKRRTLDAIFNELVNRGFFDRLDLNKEDSAAFVVKMNDIIRKNGFEAACALCFVEARRYRQQQTAMTFRDMWNDLVKSMYKDESKISHFNFGKDKTARIVEDGIHTMKDSDLDLTYVKKVANSKGVPSRAAKLLLEDPSQRKLMRTGDMMSSVGFENLQVNNPKLMKIYNAKKGTGGAKSSFGDVQYFHEMIGSRNKTFNRNKAYKVGGVRIQSFSDYVPRMVFDYVEMVADLAAKRLPAHAYTKEALFAKQFGLTGIKINLSLVPDVVKGGKAVGLDKNGNYAWNEEGTFPYNEAEKLIKAEGYKDNVGTIAVGVSDEQIRKMLADPNIMMVIPYHKSSLNPIVAEMTNVDAFTDYTDFQNTKDENGKTVKRDFDWDGKLHKLSHGRDGKLLPKDQWGNIQDVVKEYADWCKARNYTPKFSQFLYMKNGSINPGYYKMLEDFSLLSVDGEFTPQDDVRMRFPTETDAFGSMADLIAEGLDADANLEGRRSVRVAPIADEIESLAESGELLADLNQRDVDIVKNFMETADVTKGHQPQFSLVSDRDREIANLQKKVDRLTRDKRRTYGREAKEGDAVRVAKAILNDTSSDFSLNKTVKGIKNVFMMLRRGDDFAEIYGEVQGLARSIADSSYDMVEMPGAREDAELRQRFLETRKKNGGAPLKIMIPQNLIGDFDRVGGWKEFRAAHKGIVTLSVNSGISYDTFVDSIAEEFGEQYRAGGDNSGIDSLIKIIETADGRDAREPERKVYKDEDITGEIPEDVDMGVMGGYRDTEVNAIIDRLLDDISTEILPDLTFADRKAAEKDEAVRRSVNREREKWEARREKWKADRDKRIAEMKEDKRLAVEAQRANGKERLRKQAEMYRRQRERAREKRMETASRKKLLSRIYKTSQRLSQKLLKPTDSQHIPEKYRRAVADMLGWLDFENARTDAWAKRHGNVPSVRILNMRKLKDIYAKIADDEQLNKYIEPDDQINEWLDFLSDIDGSRLDDLNTEQLKTVRLVLDAISWQVNNADKALTEGLKQNRADIATQLMDELEAQKGEKLSDGMLKKFIKADSTPVHFFDRLGLTTLKTIYKELTVAQDKHIKNLSEAQNYIEKNITSKWGNTRKVGPNNSLIKKWTEEAQKYTLENGKTVEMTGAQVMSLYALNKREQARKHLLGGGAVIASAKIKRELKGGIKDYLFNKEIKKMRTELTYADITSILSKMSQDQIDAAEAMLKYLKTTSEWGNETSMKLYGYRKFTEENYFPIHSAKEFIAGSNLELQRDKKIKNQGMTKQVNEYANNPVVIDDFFEVTTAHINQMSQYNSFVPILEDFDKIYQYREYDPETSKYGRSVKELIEQKHGRWSAEYIETLMKNVNGNYGNEVADIQGFDKLLRNWKAAKIGLSIRVLAQQPTAVVRAFNEIDPKYFVGTPKRHSHKRMWEICPIAEWKHWGYSQTDIHRSMRDTMMGDKHLSDKLFFDMYGMADDLGWGMIFDAVERETKAQMKKGKLKFKYDDADYRKHVNERFRQIVDRTQVVDSVLHRSQLMRSQNTFTKAMTSFMAEPTISINTIMSAFAKAQQEARAGHKGAAVKAATRGISVFVANAVAVSMMASLISAIRESYLPDDDDDEEKELTKLQQLLIAHGVEEGSLLYDWISGYFIEDFKSNINPFAMVPVAKDLLNMYEGYEAPNPMYALPENIIKNVKNIKNWIDEDGDTRYSGRYYIERAAESVAELFGVPAANIRKELIGLQNIYYRAISEKDYGDYLQDRWELNEDYKGNKNLFIDHYLNAKKAGHDDSARDIKQQLLSSGARDSDGKKVFTDEAIQKRAWSVYAPNYKEDIIAGKNVVAQESNLRKVGVSQEDIDDKKSKALTAALSDAVADGDVNRLDSLRKSLSKYGYGDYDIDKKIKSEANSLLYDAIDAGKYNDADKYIKIITDGTEYTRKDVVSTITSHYMSDYYEALDTNDTDARDRCKSILKKYGMTDKEINMTEGAHYKDYYKAKVYAALQRGDTEEAYRIANWYVDKYPYKLENGEVKPNFQKGAEGMIFGLSRTSDSKIREYTTSDKYVTWEIPW